MNLLPLNLLPHFAIQDVTVRFLFFAHVEYRKTTAMFLQNSVSDGISNVLFLPLNNRPICTIMIVRLCKRVTTKN